MDKLQIVWGIPVKNISIIIPASMKQQLPFSHQHDRAELLIQVTGRLVYGTDDRFPWEGEFLQGEDDEGGVVAVQAGGGLVCD